MNRYVGMFLLLTLSAFVYATPVDIDCCIVASEEDGQLVNAIDIGNLTNKIDEVNRIFRQAAMSFRLRRCVITNDEALAAIDSDDQNQQTPLFLAMQADGALNLFFVKRVLGAVAFRTEFGIVMGPSCGAEVIAHEIGHACGLRDIYDEHAETELLLDGPPSKGRMPDDWGRYRRGADQRDIIRRMLMYGYTARDGCDISYGDVFGLWYTTEEQPGTNELRKVWHLSLAPVGFHAHGNRHPQSQ